MMSYRFENYVALPVRAHVLAEPENAPSSLPSHPAGLLPTVTSPYPRRRDRLDRNRNVFTGITISLLGVAGPRGTGT